MKRITIALLLAMAVMRADAQNLLPNGDFEQYTLCPDYVSQIDRCVGWSRPTHGTSDYYNACLGVPFSMNVPNNQMGDEPARSGNGYVGFYAFSDFDPVGQAPDAYREYITHALSIPLSPGTAYHVEFFVSLADVSKFAVNELGGFVLDGPAGAQRRSAHSARTSGRARRRELVGRQDGMDADRRLLRRRFRLYHAHHRQLSGYGHRSFERGHAIPVDQLLLLLRGGRFGDGTTNPIARS
ncbi:MAG: hypothetical protein IPH53_05900 [Flavobacteriales bacterium]|nr:hypothetical protein [Flavobacteriales bacterium]